MTTIKEAKAKLAPLGWTIRKTDGGDYRVAPSGAGNEPQAYYSDSLDDALNTGILEAGGNPWASECQDLEAEAIRWYRYHSTMALVSAENAQLDRNGGRLERATRLQKQSASHAAEARKIRQELSAPILPIA